jgi:hypothetical protein
MASSSGASKGVLEIEKIQYRNPILKMVQYWMPYFHHFVNRKLKLIYAVAHFIEWKLKFWD